MADQTDPVAARLKMAPATDAMRADVWDAFHAATSADDFASKIRDIKLPDAVKADLWDLKQQQAPVATFSGTNEKDAQGNAVVSALSSGVDMAKDVGVGALKGVGNTVYGLGKIVHDYTPVGRIGDAILPGAFDKPPAELSPSNTAQRVGYTGEQIGEFFLPTGELGALKKFVNAPRWVGRGLEAAKSAGLTLAQGGSPTEAGASAALSAVLPGSSALRAKASAALEGGARKSVAQALGATKEWAKDEASRLAPQMLDRGVGGSRAAMLSRAQGMVADLGNKIGAEVATAAQQGKTVSGVSFVNAIANARQTLTMTTASGKAAIVPGQEVAVKKLDQLAEFVQGLGGDIPIDKAQALKVAWDKIVSKSGLYGPKSMSSASDNAKAWAFREASSSMRKLIATESPTVAALNQEFHFWKGLDSVLSATEKRTQAQAGGLTAGIMGAAGAASGFATGDSWTDKFEKAVFGGIVGKQLVSAVQSPAFRTQVSAPLKMALADALAAGDQGKVLHALSRISSAMPSQVRQLATAK